MRSTCLVAACLLVLFLVPHPAKSQGCTLNKRPTAGFSADVDGLTVDFDDSSNDADGSIQSWEWDFGDRTGSSQRNPSHTYDGPGTYEVILTVTDDCGDQGKTDEEITLEAEGNQSPAANFTFTTDQLTATFTDTSSDDDGDIKAWLWSFGDGESSTLADPTHTYAAAGTYGVSLTVTDDEGDEGSRTKSVTVAPDEPDEEWMTTPAIPGFRFRAQITSPQGVVQQVRMEPGCIGETLCVSGAIPGRSEIFVRIVGPKPNGYLWPTLVKFTTSQVDVWIEQMATGVVKQYTLDGARAGFDELPGLFDRLGFLPSNASAAGDMVALRDEVRMTSEEARATLRTSLPVLSTREALFLPGGPIFRSASMPSFSFKVRVLSPEGEEQEVRQEAECIPETICVSAAIPGRSEIFIRVVGPKPNGYLWPTLVKFTTSQVDVWAIQDRGEAVRFFSLPAAAPGFDELDGLFDRRGFLPQSSCCAAHPSPGCDDSACQTAVCATDAHCCQLDWDVFCADQANLFCPTVCTPAGGSCCEPHPEAECDDPACEDLVCAADSFCCDSEWDEVCSFLAGSLCGGRCDEVLPGGCCGPNPVPGCADFDCAGLVCALDQSCCTVEWDEPCADLARDVCGCDAPGLGDECPDAIPLVDGVPLLGELLDNTGFGDVDSCGAGTESVDEWFVYTATCTGQAVFDLERDATEFDAVQSVFADCPIVFGDVVEADELACIDDPARVSVAVTEGETYFLRVSAFDDEIGSGVFEVVAGCMPIGEPSPGDECTDPLFLPEGEVIEGDLLDNTGAGDDDSCGGFEAIDEWYEYFAPCTGEVTLSTCLPGTGLDTLLAVFDGCGGEELGCVDDVEGCGFDEYSAVLKFPAEEGTRYLVRVTASSDEVFNGPFQLIAECSP